MQAREQKVPKFKRCKIARPQLLILTQSFGARPPVDTKWPRVSLLAYPALGALCARLYSTHLALVS